MCQDVNTPYRPYSQEDFALPEFQKIKHCKFGIQKMGMLMMCARCVTVFCFRGSFCTPEPPSKTCELAAINLIFLGFPRFATMVADFINCLPHFMKGWGVISSLQKWKIQGGGGVLSEIPSVVGVWIFSGTTHCIILLRTHNNLV